MATETTTTEKTLAQWRASWRLLTSAQRVAVFEFLCFVDRDIGAAVLRVAR